MIPTRNDIQTVLEAHFPCFAEVVHTGFHKYSSGKAYGLVKSDHSPRTRASSIHDEIVAAAKERLVESKGFRRIPTRVRNLFDFSGQFVIQFKKLSKHLLPSNYPTKTADLFDAQENLVIPTIPPTLPRLTLGYRPNRFWTDLDGVFLCLVCEKKVVEFWDLSQCLRDRMPLATVFDSHEQAAPRIKPTVRPKVARRKRRQSGSA